MQVSMGTRLPIMQGASFAFIAPTIALLGQAQFSCQALATEIKNGTTIYFEQGQMTDFDTIWTKRMREVQEMFANF